MSQSASRYRITMHRCDAWQSCRSSGRTQRNDRNDIRTLEANSFASLAIKKLDLSSNNIHK
ncbi:hypothetical protein D917_08258, partial [Trichinella nativa]